MNKFILLVIFLCFKQFTFAQANNTVKKDGKSNLDTADIYTCAFLEECSLTTSNSSKIWCTEVSLKTIILENYSFPFVSDSSTFEKRENYLLSLFINKIGKLDSVNISGCSSSIVKNEISKAILSAGLNFFPAKDKNGNTDSYVYYLTLRSYSFSRASLKGLVSPQKPMELSEEQKEEKNKSARTYRTN